MPQIRPFMELDPFPDPLTGEPKQPPGPQRGGRGVFANKPTPSLTPGTRSPQQKPLDVPSAFRQKPRAPRQEEEWERVRREHIRERQRIDKLNEKIGLASDKVAGSGFGEIGSWGSPYPDYINPGDPNPSDLFSESQLQQQRKMDAENKKIERRRKASYLDPRGSIVHPVARYTKGRNMGKPVAGM